MDHRELLEPFIEATRTALAELAGVEAVVDSTGEANLAVQADDVSAVVHLSSAHGGCIVLIFPEPTATALAKRVLAESMSDVDNNLISDCVGEIANVICGQAKALLAATPHRFTFDLPTTFVGAISAPIVSQINASYFASFRTEAGPFVMRLTW